MSNDRDGFVNGILGFPSAIYRRGSEHGKEWTRMYRGDESSHCQQSDTPCPYRRHDRTTAAQAGDGNGDDSNEWMHRVVRDLEKNEERAQVLYSSWKQEEELEKARMQQEQEASRSRWWGRRCQRAKHDPEDAQEQGMAEAHREIKEPKTSQAMTPVVLPTDFDGTRKDLEKKWNEWDKDVDRFIRDADAWRKQWFSDDNMWPGTDLFGSGMPFSRPLSSLFALGMAPAFVRFEPDSHPMGYLLYSPYSPLALEHCHGFGENWRNRFEDLLRAEEGKELMSQEEMDNANTATGMAWLSKRILPLLSKRRECPETEPIERGGGTERRQITGTDPYTEPATEQDTYDAYHGYFGDMPRDPMEHAVDMKAFQAKSQLPKPDVLSTLTTTERHVAPDGRITTKTVLKRRFSDGREETEEKTETTKGPAILPHSHQHHMPSSLAEHRKQREVQQPCQEPVPKKGWFWSS